MAGLAAALYGVIAYALFLGTFLYAIGFVGNLPLPKTIDSGEPGALLPSLAIDAALLAVFAIQHSVMARPGFKRWWTRLVPHPVERTTYVLLASAALALLFWQWRPLPAPIWDAAHPAGALALNAIACLGWVLVLLSTFAISHFELFGLKQVLARLQGRELRSEGFQTPSVYAWVRHPIYLGFLLAFWATPRMTLGHLVFALGTTGYILIGIQFEERDLVAAFGERYRAYRGRVPMLLPRVRRPVVDAPDAELPR